MFNKKLNKKIHYYINYATNINKLIKRKFIKQLFYRRNAKAHMFKFQLYTNKNANLSVK
jgi:hypothetical protein